MTRLRSIIRPNLISSRTKTTTNYSFTLWQTRYSLPSSVILCTGSLKGPLPTDVSAAIVKLYCVNAFRLPTTSSVSVLLKLIAVMLLTLTVYIMMMPFWSSRDGGCHDNLTLVELTTNAEMFWGGLAGTDGGRPSRWSLMLVSTCMHASRTCNTQQKPHIHHVHNTFPIHPHNIPNTHTQPPHPSPTHTRTHKTHTHTYHFQMLQQWLNHCKVPTQLMSQQR